jgi:hypothetical protein
MTVGAILKAGIAILHRLDRRDGQSSLMFHTGMKIIRRARNAAPLFSS